MLRSDNKINVVRTILDQPAFPPAALPVVTFDDSIELYFGGERLELVHVSPAHTASDVAVILRGLNVVHTGDVFLSGAYPFADVDNGGDFDGDIEFCRGILARIDRDTIIVPGHGRNASYADSGLHRDARNSARPVVELIGNGATLEQVVAAQPTKEWDAQYGNPTTFFFEPRLQEPRRQAVAQSSRKPRTIGCRAARMLGNSPPRKPRISA